MSKKALKAALDLLDSDRAKDRNEGADRLRACLATASAVVNVPTKTWTDVVGSVADAVTDARNALDRKDTLPNQRRLSECAALFRWTVERGYLYFPRKAVKKSLEHVFVQLGRSGNSRRGVYRPLALDYFRSLRTIFSHRPHLEHLEQLQWMNAVQLGFGAALYDQISFLKDQQWGRNDQEQQELLLFDADPEDALNAATSLNGAPHDKKHPDKLCNSQELFEVFLMLAYLLISPNANIWIVGQPPPFLSRMIRLFETLAVVSPRTDSTAHLPLLQALNALLTQIGVNDHTSLIKLAPRIWPYLIKLWSYKSLEMKEQLIAALLRLSPYVLTGKQKSSHASQCATLLWEAILSEPDGRLRVQDLKLSALELITPATRSPVDMPGQRRLFTLRTIQAPSLGFSSHQALTWSILKLGARCLKCLFEESDDIMVLSPAADLASPRPTKRVKVQDPVSLLLYRVTDTAQSNAPSTLFYLQLLYFFLAQHYESLPISVQISCFSTINGLVSQADSDVQSWALVTLGLLATYDVSETASPLGFPQGSPNKRKVAKAKDTGWTQLWSFGVRNLSSKNLARAAAQLCYNISHEVLILGNKESLVGSTRIMQDFENLLKDLQLQAPSFPSDSVCHLFALLVSLSRTDVRLHKASATDKTVHWLTAPQWSPLGKRTGAAKNDHFSMRSFFSLLLNCVDVKLSDIAQDVMVTPLWPRCEVARVEQDMEETRLIHTFVADAELPVSSPSSVSASLGASQRQSTSSEKSDSVSHALLNFLHKCLEPLTEQNAELVKGWLPPTHERLKRVLEFSSLFLLFYATCFTLRGLNKRIVLQTCHAVLVDAVPHMLSPKWTAEERHELLQILGLVFLPFDRRREEVRSAPHIWREPAKRNGQVYVGISPPCKSSGIPYEVEQLYKDQSEQRLSRLHPVVVAIWQETELSDLIKAGGVIQLYVRAILLPDEEQPESTPETNGKGSISASPHVSTQTAWSTQRADDLSDDDFGTPLDAGTALLRRREGSGGGTFASKATSSDFSALVSKQDVEESSLLVALRGVVTTASLARTPRISSSLCDVLVQATLEQQSLLLQALSHLVDAGAVIVLADIEKILEAIGTDLLPDYAFARSGRLFMALIDFLAATIPAWIRPQLADSSADQEDDPGPLSPAVATLCSWLTEMCINHNLFSWRVRLRLCIFLDRFLELSPYSQSWGHPQEHPLYQDLRIRPPTLIQHMLKDVDIRVTFRLCVSAARLIDLYQTNQGPVEQFFMDATNALSHEIDSPQKMMMRILALANMMAVSAYVRRAPYDNLIKLTIPTKVYDQHVKAVLCATASRLGIPSIRVFHVTFVVFVAQNCINSGHNITDISEVVLGYASRKERFEDVFRALGSIYLQRISTRIGDRSFKMLCEATGRTVRAGIRECLPAATAEMLSNTMQGSIDAGHDTETKLMTLEKTLAELCKLAKASDMDPSADCILLLLDKIVVELLLMIYAKDVSCHGPLPRAIEQVQEYANQAKNGSRIYKQLLGNSNQGKHIQQHDYALQPQYVLFVLGWLNSKYPVWNNESVIYLSAHRLFSMIKQCPFVDLQIRYLVSLLVFVALGSDNLVRLQRMLLHGLSCLYENHGSLRETTWPAIHWFIQFYPHVSRSLSDHEFHSMVQIPAIATRMGIATRKHQEDRHLSELKACILNVYIKHPKEEIRAQGTEIALLLWPDQVDTTLDLSDLFGIVSRCSIPAMKFSLVHALRRRLGAERLGPLTQQELASLLWQLLAALHPDNNTINASHASDFAHLLWTTDTNIVPPRLERPNGSRADSASSHLPIPGSPDKYDSASVRSQMIGALASLLTQDDLQLVDSAAAALQRIFSLFDFDQALPVLDNENANEDLALLSVFEFRRPFDAFKGENDRHIKEIRRSEWVTKARSFPKWISAISRLFLQVISQSDPFYAQMVDPRILDNQAFVSLVLPTLSLALLKHADAREHLSAHFTAVLSSTTVDPLVASSVTTVLLYLRNFPCRPSKNPLSGDEWLQVPWTIVATNALRFGAPLTTLLALELAHKYEEVDASMDSNVVRNSLFALYEELDEPDGFYGISSYNANESLVRKYRHEHRFNSAFEMDGAMFEASEQRSTGSIAKSLSSFGFAKLAMFLNSGAAASEEQRDLSYSLAWRTETWDLPVPTLQAQASDQSGAYSLFNVFKAIHQSRDASQAEKVLDNAFLEEILRTAAHVSVESPLVKKDNINTLLVLQECKQWLATSGYNAEAGSLDLFQSLSVSMPFSAADAILNARVSLLKSVQRREEAASLSDTPSDTLRRLLETELDLHLTAANAARQSDRNQLALNSVILASGIQDILDDEGGMLPNIELQEESAYVYWARGEHSMALSVLSQLLDTIRTDGTRVKPMKLARLQAQIGAWTSEARLRPALQTLVEYFDPALRDIPPDAPAKDTAHIYHQLFAFADRQLVALDSQAASMNKLEQSHQRRTAQIAEVAKRLKQTSTDEISQTMAQSHKALEEDAEKITAYRTEHRQFLSMTLEQLIRILEVTDEHDDLVFRLTSLWFAHASSEPIMQHIYKEFRAIPRSKFVFIVHQLTARLTKQHQQGSSTFLKMLTLLVDNLCCEHPYHVLYQLYALRRASAKNESAARRGSSANMQLSADQYRARAAEDVLNRCKKRSERVTAIAKHVDQCCSAYQQWAAFDVRTIPPWKERAVDEEGDPKKKKRKVAKQSVGSGVSIPEQMHLRRIKDVPIPVSTLELPVDRSTQYLDPGPTIVRYSELFTTSGGIHLPKITTCIASDGRRIRQLFKGGDDTRQDAVMEQVFGLVNQLLSRDKQTSRRNLQMRTYKIIPLSPDEGLMEFVTNTKSLSEIMNTLLHEFRPKDWTYSVCRNKISVAQKSNATDIAHRVKVFEEVLANNKPVFRNFFYKAHKQPAQWFEQRLKYSRSVAVVSIVGYALGIGDRHTSNLLLDVSQGEIVPIDFGITFDAGSRLPIPELVPFRLTQNFVDGFGMTGVEGVYKRCCEEILRVLRDRAPIIMTILDVFKYDPLQKWTISAAKIQRVQNSQLTNAASLTGRPQRGLSALPEGVTQEEDDMPALAAQALSGVADKLSSALSVEYKVNELIGQAMDPRRLAVIFSGWQPYI